MLQLQQVTDSRSAPNLPMAVIGKLYCLVLVIGGIRKERAVTVGSVRKGSYLSSTYEMTLTSCNCLKK
jgi:hypothetical protein